MLTLMFFAAQVQSGTDTLLSSRVQKAIAESEKKTIEEITGIEEGKILQDAARVVAGIRLLIRTLSYGDLEGAYAILSQLDEQTDSLYQKYSGKVENFPVNAVVAVVVGVEDPDRAEEMYQEARKLINERKLPEARPIVDALRNEVVVTVSTVPLKVLKSSLDLARSLMDRGNIQGAIDALNLFLSSIETYQVSYPKPLFDASYILDVVINVHQKDPQLALELLKEVKKRIRLAYVLGYIDRSTMDSILRGVDKIEESIKGGKEQTSQLKSMQEKIKKEKKALSR